MTPNTNAGTIASLWRYPVKSMVGEMLAEARLTEQGFPGDRGLALEDRENGTIASAKRLPRLFEFRAAIIEGGAVRITLPGGEVITSGRDDCDSALSRALGREVALRSGEGFHDCAVVHLLTTATLAGLGSLSPGARFDPRRFRPNIVVDSAPGPDGFVENGWIGHILAIGDQVRLRVTAPCERCVMTTLPQEDLPAEPEILETAARHNHAQVGVYAEVLRAGTIRRGDAVALTER